MFSLGYQSSRFKFRLNKADRWRSKPAWLKRLEPWDGFWETIQRWTERANLDNYKWIWSPRENNVAFYKEKNVFIQPPNCKPALRVTRICDCLPIFAFSSFKSSLHATEICLASPKEAEEQVLFSCFVFRNHIYTSFHYSASLTELFTFAVNHLLSST